MREFGEEPRVSSEVELQELRELASERAVSVEDALRDAISDSELVEKEIRERRDQRGRPQDDELGGEGDA